MFNRNMQYDSCWKNENYPGKENEINKSLLDI